MIRGRPQHIVLKLSQEQIEALKEISFRPQQAPKTQLRAQILLALNSGKSINEVMLKHSVSKDQCYRLLKRFNEEGLNCLYDRERSGRPVSFDERDKSFIRKTACQRPYNLPKGPDCILWDLQNFTTYLRENGPKMGYPHLKQLVPATLEKILSKSELFMHVKEPIHATPSAGMTICLYKRLEFLVTTINNYYQQKSHVVIDYSDLENQNLKDTLGQYHRNAYTSIENNILSLMLSIDLSSGQIVACPSKILDEYSFSKFIRKLREIYQDTNEVYLILDQHHIYKSTALRALYKSEKPKIKCIFEPKNTEYLNYLEKVLSKLLRLYISGINANSYDELLQKIHSCIDIYNSFPIVNPEFRMI